MRRKSSKPRAQPRALQARPTISFRTDRAVLERLDELAEGYAVTRNDLMERVIRLYLEERGEDLNLLMGVADDAQLDIFA